MAKEQLPDRGKSPPKDPAISTAVNSVNSVNPIRGVDPTAFYSMWKDDLPPTVIPVNKEIYSRYWYIIFHNAGKFSASTLLEKLVDRFIPDNALACKHDDSLAESGKTTPIKNIHCFLIFSDRKRCLLDSPSLMGIIPPSQWPGKQLTCGNARHNPNGALKALWFTNGKENPNVHAYPPGWDYKVPQKIMRKPRGPNKMKKLEAEIKKIKQNVYSGGKAVTSPNSSSDDDSSDMKAPSNIPKGKKIIDEKEYQEFLQFRNKPLQRQQRRIENRSLAVDNEDTATPQSMIDIPLPPVPPTPDKGDITKEVTNSVLEKLDPTLRKIMESIDKLHGDMESLRNTTNMWVPKVVTSEEVHSEEAGPSDLTDGNSKDNVKSGDKRKLIEDSYDHVEGKPSASKKAKPSVKNMKSGRSKKTQ